MTKIMNAENQKTMIISNKALLEVATVWDI